jgi:hypothetical protein
MMRTVEQRIVGNPDTSTDQYQSSDSAKETFRWTTTSGAAESRSSFCELLLDLCPRFLRVGGRHDSGVCLSVGVALCGGAGGDDGGTASVMRSRELCRRITMIHARRMPSLYEHSLADSCSVALGSDLL